MKPLSAKVRAWLDEQAAARVRRLGLAGATWSAGALGAEQGARTVQAELRGLAFELQAAGLHALGDALQAAGEAMSSLEVLEGEEAHHGRRVLVLDDTEVTSDLVALALEGAGCVVTVAHSAADCLERFQTMRPDAFLLEPAHPDLGTPEACRELLRRANVSILPIVLFSGRPEAELRDFAEAVGADAFVSKDHGLREMTDQVQSVLSTILW